jgi:hypothetical protein
LPRSVRRTRFEDNEFPTRGSASAEFWRWAVGAKSVGET